MNGLISIVTPVYNTGIYLKRYFDSLLSQTYQNFEIILVNNNSSDEITLDIIDTYAKKDKRIKVIEEKRQGLSIAYNTGLNNINGDYICIVDSDDYLKKDALEILINNIEDNDFVQASFILKYDHFSLYRPKPKNDLINKEEALYLLSKNTKVNNYAWAKLYQSSLLKDIRFNETYNNFSDMEFSADVFLKANKIKTIKNRIYYYYQRKGSSTNGMSYLEARNMFKRFKMQEDKISAYYPYSNHEQFYRSELMILLAYITNKKVIDKDDIYLPSYDDQKINIFLKFIRLVLWKIVCIKYHLGNIKIKRGEV